MVKLAIKLKNLTISLSCKRVGPGSLGISHAQLSAMTVFYITNLLQWDLPCFNPMDD